MKLNLLSSLTTSKNMDSGKQSDSCLLIDLQISNNVTQFVDISDLYISDILSESQMLIGQELPSNNQWMGKVDCSLVNSHLLTING